MGVEVGSQVAHYRLERLLGVGGMGQVYLARDTRLDRLVAIKFLTAPADERARRRLLHEAKAVAALDHRGICAVYEVGNDPAGGDFIAMQYVEGETLAERLRHSRLRPEETLSLGAQVAEALMAAHRHGLIHRDLKPHNIVITPSGAPKLLDFGLATYAANSAGAADADTTSEMTDPGTVVGTRAYMSPEQIRNARVDFRTDVFALGCVLYECFTGRRAFSGATPAETLAAVLHVDPPLVSAVVPDLGPVYDALCARLLAKIPAERFQSAEEVLGAIRAFTPSSTISASGASAIPAPPRRVRVSRVIAAAAAIAVAVAAYAFWPWRAGLPQPPAEAVRYYEIGTDAIRDGTYAAAKSALEEAIKKFPDYAQAYSRLAEADIALDDEREAKDALLKAADLVPDRSRLPAEDRLRFDAASAAAQREYDAAIQSYRALADLQQQDAGRWLDVGRAEEAAQHFSVAREVYAKVVALDGESAAARLRLGRLQARAGQTKEGLDSIEEAIRLYKVKSRSEGEAESLVQKGRALARIGKSDDARENFEKVMQLAAAQKFPAQRVTAQFGLAGLLYRTGQLTEAENLARAAVQDAKDARLPTLAAAGLTDLGLFLMARSLNDAADAQFSESIRLAHERGAVNIEMRARTQQASLRVRSLQPKEALELAEGPAAYFKKVGETQMAIDATNILSRANESLEHYDDASKQAAEAISFSESSKDDIRMGDALENLAGQLTKLGRLPDALEKRQRVDEIHRRLNAQDKLPYDLANHAELLIWLGRGRDAAELLAELDKGIAENKETYVLLRARIALVRALHASIERRWRDTLAALDQVTAALPAPAPGKAAAPNTTRSFARILREHALAQMKRSQVPAAELATWPLEATSPANRREWSVWVAQTLVARGDRAAARSLLDPVLKEKVGAANLEWAWRAAAVIGDTAGAKAGADQVKTLYGSAAAAYFSRPDLVALLTSVH